jgi:hypothetical protein
VEKSAREICTNERSILLGENGLSLYTFCMGKLHRYAVKIIKREPIRILGETQSKNKIVIKMELYIKVGIEHSGRFHMTSYMNQCESL